MSILGDNINKGYIPFKGDYHPATVYEGQRTIFEPKTKEVSGENIDILEIEDTYNDTIDELEIHGQTHQDTGRTIGVKTDTVVQFDDGLQDGYGVVEVKANENLLDGTSDEWVTYSTTNNYYIKWLEFEVDEKYLDKICTLSMCADCTENVFKLTLKESETHSIIQGQYGQGLVCLTFTPRYNKYYVLGAGASSCTEISFKTKNTKFELGDKATPWIPSVADQQAGVAMPEYEITRTDSVTDKIMIPYTVGSDGEVDLSHNNKATNGYWLIDGTRYDDTRIQKTGLAEGTVVWLVCDSVEYYSNSFTSQSTMMDLSDLQGRVTSYLSLSNCPNITGDLSDLQGGITNTLNLSNCPNITGDLSDLQGRATSYLSFYNCPNITGDLSDLQGNITNTLSLYNCKNITGDLSDLQGNVSYYLSLYNCKNITGDLSELRGNVSYYLNLSNCSNITGDLSDLQGNVSYYLCLYNCKNITGDLSELRGNVSYYLNLCNCPNITGDLSDLQGNITNTLDLSNCKNITGDLSDLRGNASYYLSLSNCSNITGVYTQLSPPKYVSWGGIHLSGTKQTPSDVDGTLIALASASQLDGAVIKQNTPCRVNARTSASDEAVATLKSLGWAVYCEGVLQ